MDTGLWYRTPGGCDRHDDQRRTRRIHSESRTKPKANTKARRHENAKTTIAAASRTSDTPRSGRVRGEELSEAVQTQRTEGHEGAQMGSRPAPRRGASG